MQHLHVYNSKDNFEALGEFNDTFINFKKLD